LDLRLNKNIKEEEAMVIFSTISQKIFFDEKQKEKIVIVSPLVIGIHFSIYF
jgi:hypothetical protein